MKLTKLSSVLNSVTRLGSINELLGSSLFYSTTTTTTPTPTPKPTQRWFRQRGKDQLNQLYRRISPVGDPKVSIVPILDQWIQEGKSVNKAQLNVFIKELRFYKRYAHALEISMWMSDKRYYRLTPWDVAARLDLMSKVLGIKQVEKYFDNISQQLKVPSVYGAFLNCYVYAKSVDKAEAVMQKMKDLGFAMNVLIYNNMLSLYFRTGHLEKSDALMQEMEENNIACDSFTFGIQLNAYAAISDIERMEKTLTRMESDAKVVPDWSIYAIAANGYKKVGLVDKALEMLKKSEELVTSKKRSTMYNHLLTQYAAIGKKDEVLRLWKVYQNEEVVYNKGYLCVMASLLKLDEFESVEKIFEEWESRKLDYDMHIPNLLIIAYSRKGLVEKAETFVDRAISKRGKPDGYTWFPLALGYLQSNQTPKAVEMIKKARPGFKLKPTSKSLVSCLEYLKVQGDLEKAEQFIKLLLDNDIISVHAQETLLNNISGKKSHSDAFNASSDNSVFQSENALKFSESEGERTDFLSKEKC